MNIRFNLKIRNYIRFASLVCLTSLLFISGELFYVICIIALVPVILTCFYFYSLLKLLLHELIRKKIDIREPSEAEKHRIFNLAKKGISNDKVYIKFTNEGGFTLYIDILRRTLIVSEIWFNKWAGEQKDALIVHEFAHLKYFKRYILELLSLLIIIVIFVVAFLYLLVSLHIISALGAPLEYWFIFIFLAFFPMIFQFVSWRNEFRADSLSRELLGLNSILSVLKGMEKEGGFNEDSETHPSIKKRIKKLMETENPETTQI